MRFRTSSIVRILNNYEIKTRHFGNISSFRNVVLSSNSLESGWGTKSEHPLILCVIHHRQNPIESTIRHVWGWQLLVEDKAVRQDLSSFNTCFQVYHSCQMSQSALQRKHFVRSCGPSLTRKGPWLLWYLPGGSGEIPEFGSSINIRAFTQMRVCRLYTTET
jgi:hypothetical protein